MIIEKIETTSSRPKRILFPMWARTPIKDGLSEFPSSVKSLGGAINTVAVIDDLLPALLFCREKHEQAEINETYAGGLKSLGFDEYHFLSDLDFNPSLMESFQVLRRYTTSEFEYVLPGHKVVDNDYNGREVFEFIWQLLSLAFSLRKLNCDSVIAGMATRHFYYNARKFLPKNINLYFAQGKSPKT